MSIVSCLSFVSHYPLARFQVVSLAGTSMRSNDRSQTAADDQRFIASSQTCGHVVSDHITIVVVWLAESMDCGLLGKVSV